MPYKDKSKQLECQRRHYQRNKKQRLAIFKKGVKKYRSRNRGFIDRVKRLRGCKKCGYRKCVAALEFHHRDSKEKDGILSRMAQIVGDLERIKDEIRKCDVLCANCHRETHYLVDSNRN